MMDLNLTAANKRRQELYNEMTPATQELAKEIAEKQDKMASSTVGVCYDIGLRVLTALGAEVKYGTNAVEQIAEYTGISKTLLYAYRTIAVQFDKNFVRDWTTKQMADGGHLTVSHWYAIARLESKADRDKWLKKCLTDSLTANQLTDEIAGSDDERTSDRPRTGGRGPSVPTSPQSGLQRTFSMAQKFVNFEQVLEASVFEKVAKLPPDMVDDNLLRQLEKAKDELVKQKTSTQHAIDRLDDNIERINRVLANQQKQLANDVDENTSQQFGYDDDGSSAAEVNMVVPRKAAPAPKKQPRKASRRPSPATI